MIDRSFLFVPANRPQRFDKACEAGADVAIIDLEDAVAPPDKAAARQAVLEWLDGTRAVYLRINGAETDWLAEDLPLLSRPGVRGVMLPKAESADTIARVHSAGPQLPVIALIESARGLRNVEAIAQAGCARLAFGSVDFQLDLGITGEGEELLFARSALVLASRLAGLPAPIDGVTLALDDATQLATDVSRARRLGFGGKLCIHPRQVQVINDGFAVPRAELEWARRVIDAAAQAGGNAVRLDGKLIDLPIIERARALLASAGGRP